MPRVYGSNGCAECCTPQLIQHCTSTTCQTRHLTICDLTGGDSFSGLRRWQHHPRLDGSPAFVAATRLLPDPRGSAPKRRHSRRWCWHSTRRPATPRCATLALALALATSQAAHTLFNPRRRRPPAPAGRTSRVPGAHRSDPRRAVSQWPRRRRHRRHDAAAAGSRRGMARRRGARRPGARALGRLPVSPAGGVCAHPGA